MIHILLLAFAAQVFYWLLLRSGFRRAVRASPVVYDAADSKYPPSRQNTPTGEPAGLPSVSVIVAARNEEADLPHLLRALEQQDHPSREVVVVDDGSTDRTSAVLASWRNRLDENRRACVQILRTPGIGKKAALARGIAAARHELLAFTDADCIPPRGWLSSLARAHAGLARAHVGHPEETLLVGYSPFRRRHGLINHIARYETFVTGFLTAAAAGLGRPYMAVGRNISYSRRVFDRANGFERIMHSMSGDDDLFVQQVALRQAADIRVLLDADSFVPSDGPQDVREWLQQKRRHTSAGRYYRPAVKAHLAAFHGSGLIIWLAPVLAGWTGLLLLVARLVLQHVILREAARELHEGDLVPIQPLLEPLYQLYVTVVAPVGLLRLPQRW